MIPSIKSIWQTRAKEINAKLVIDSKNSNGTKISLFVGLFNL